MQRPFSHTLVDIQQVLDFRTEFGLTAGNTHMPRPLEDLYTLRATGVRRQLDYALYTPSRMIGNVFPLSLDQSPFQLSDHRIVVADISVVPGLHEAIMTSLALTQIKANWLGWEPNSVEESCACQANILEL